MDISTYPDLDPTFTWIDGPRAVAEALARRLETPRGGLFYDPQYGYDVRAWLNEDLDPTSVFVLESEIQEECLKDERVADASVSLTFVSSTMRLSISVELAEGPFELVLAIDNVSARVLSVEAA